MRIWDINEGFYTKTLHSIVTNENKKPESGTFILKSSNYANEIVEQREEFQLEGSYIANVTFSDFSDFVELKIKYEICNWKSKYYERFLQTPQELIYKENYV